MSDKKQWKELNTPQKASGLLIGFVQVSLLIAALVDIRRRPAEQIRGRKMWWALAAFVNFIGPISYFAFGRKQPTALITAE